MSTTSIHSDAAYPLDEASIIEFAQQFDPQPYHLDAKAGAESIFGGLCASGWQVAAVSSQLIDETLEAAGIRFVCLTSVSSLRWKRPTFVDETIAASIDVGERIAGSAVPGCDSLGLEVLLKNADGNDVAVVSCKVAVDASEATS